MERIEEAVALGVLAAQPVDDQAHLHAARRRIDQPLAHRGAGRVVDIDVIEHPERPLGAAHQVEQRLQPLGPVRQQSQAVAVDLVARLSEAHRRLMREQDGGGKRGETFQDKLRTLRQRSNARGTIRFAPPFS
jgi:hypothetical protein